MFLLLLFQLVGSSNFGEVMTFLLRNQQLLARGEAQHIFEKLQIQNSQRKGAVPKVWVAKTITCVWNPH